MNRVINKYGALQANDIVKDAEDAAREFEDKIRKLIKFYGLTPDEIIALAQKFSNAAVFSEELLRLACNMRKAETEATKKMLGW